ncbi:MAG: hypothetical protein ACRD2P_15475 [Terriglobia bacterium]
MISATEAREKSIALHPEFKNWKDKDYDKAESEEGVNWRLHLLVDGVVFRRASDPSLPDAAVIRELEGKGWTTASAVHEIARIVAENLWELMQPASEARGGKGKKPLDDGPAGIEARNERTNQRIAALAER